MTRQVLQGDCIERMAEMEEASVDAIVCDPPYGIGFMGREWDVFAPAAIAKREAQRDRKTTTRTSAKYPDKVGASQGGGPAVQYDESLSGNQRFQAWMTNWAAEVSRVLKPGGHLLAFGGTRTYHRLACAIEDAGFEMRDSLLWLYGSGFPKSLNVSKAIDKAAGAEREVVGRRVYGDGQVYEGGDAAGRSGGAMGESVAREPSMQTAPATPEAAQWEGWGTALKPSHDPIVVARKPLIGNVAENVLEHGTGGINVDGCRIPSGADHREKCESVVGLDSNRNVNAYGAWNGERESSWSPQGRWPANVVLSEEAAAELDGQTGILHGHGSAHHRGRDKGIFDWGTAHRAQTGGESGGASRFFYCAKTSRAEREAGLAGFKVRTADPYGQHRGRRMEDKSRIDGKPAKEGRNHHPTVKPINLMRWLVRLVTPPDGTVLDCFLGSGSTGCAAVLEGFDFVGIEREAEYIAIAEARIAFWAQHVGKEVEDVLGLHTASRRAAEAHAERGQITLEEALEPAA